MTPALFSASPYPGIPKEGSAETCATNCNIIYIIYLYISLSISKILRII